jgi:hypothetical protein
VATRPLDAPRTVSVWVPKPLVGTVVPIVAAPALLAVRVPPAEVRESQKTDTDSPAWKPETTTLIR